MIRFNSFLFIILCSSLLISQNNDEISNAIEILCDTPIESTTVGYMSDQEQLTEWGVNDCGTAVDSSPGVWYYVEGDDSDYVLRMCDSSYDTKLHIFQDDADKRSYIVFDNDSSPVNEKNIFIDDNLLHDVL